MGHSHNPRGRQRGLPGLDLEDEDGPLPSEQVLKGEVLKERRREALDGLRAALGERPEGYAPEEWQVVLAVLAPAAGSTLSAGGARARLDRATTARACFPGLSTPAALRAFLEVSARPHVAECVASFRALELLDVMAQRDMMRDAAYELLEMGLAGRAHEATDPSGAARLGAVGVQALKFIMDLDGLRAVRPGASSDGDTGAGGPSGASIPGMATEDPLEALRRKVALVADDVTRRAALVPGDDAP